MHASLDLEQTYPASAANARAKTVDVGRSARRLLILTSLFLLVNTLSLALFTSGSGAGQAEPTTLVGVLLSWHLSALAGMWVLRRQPQADSLLYAVAMFLAAWGLIIITRLLPDFGVRQALWLLIASALFIATITLPRVLSLLRTYRYTLLIISLALIALTVAVGTNPDQTAGAPKLWIGAGGIYFQPSELLKIIMIAFLASYLAEQSPILRTQSASQPAATRWKSLSPRVVGPVVLMWGLSMIFLILQRDLGAAMIFFLVFLILLYVSSGYNATVVVGSLLILAAGIGAYFAFGVVRLRVDIWLNPWPEADGRAYQIVQSLMAVANGGIFGQGIAQGYPDFIPVIHSDFVFAALAEEWGLIGVVALVGANAAFVLRGFMIAIRQGRQAFRVLLAVGLTSLFAIQSLLILGGVLKLIPLTGVTLPLVSYGGSSLVVNFILLGLLMRLSAGGD